MSSLSHEERIVSRVRDTFCNRCTMEWGAHTCGINTAEFEGYYNQYIQRLCYSIQHKQEWFLLAELEYLLRAGYMRPDEGSSRFKVPQENIENWLKEKEETDGKPDWHDMRIMRKTQGGTNENSTE